MVLKNTFMSIHMARFDFGREYYQVVLNLQWPDLRRGNYPLLRTLESPSSSLARGGRGGAPRTVTSFGP